MKLASGDVPDEAWASDRVAELAFEDKWGGEYAEPAVVIRCSMTRGGSACNTRLGEVWNPFFPMHEALRDLPDPPKPPILRLYWWSISEEVRSAANREESLVMLDACGSRGLYFCRYHGILTADLDRLREIHRRGFFRARPTMQLRVGPT